MPRLPDRLPNPRPTADGLSAPYREGVRRERLVIQRCRDCRTWQWGPEWFCRSCLSFDLGWEAVAGRGRVVSWRLARQPALRGALPEVSVLVELPEAGNVLMAGNLVTAMPIEAGTWVDAVFVHHDDADPPFTLVSWVPAG